jgi:hypothetical protein
MPKSAQDFRPPYRKARLDVPVDFETLDKARRRAGGETRRLRAAIRAFLELWGNHKLDLPEKDIDWQAQRAQKRRRSSSDAE